MACSLSIYSRWSSNSNWRTVRTFSAAVSFFGTKTRALNSGFLSIFCCPETYVPGKGHAGPLLINDESVSLQTPYISLHYLRLPNLFWIYGASKPSRGKSHTQKCIHSGRAWAPVEQRWAFRNSASLLCSGELRALLVCNVSSTSKIDLGITTTASDLSLYFKRI